MIKTFTLPSVLISNTIVNSFRIALKNKDKIATRKTFDSLRVINRVFGNLIEFEMYSDKSIIFIQKGRGANKKPPPSSVILEWIKARRITPTKGTQESLAFLIARSIGKKGIKPTNIIGEAEAIMNPRIKLIIGASMVSYSNEIIKDFVK